MTPAPFKTRRSRSFPPFQYSISPSYPVQRQLRPTTLLPPLSLSRGRAYRKQKGVQFETSWDPRMPEIYFQGDSDISLGRKPRYGSRNQQAFTNEATITIDRYRLEDSDISIGRRPKYRSRYLHDEAATTIDPSGLPFLEYSGISQGQRPKYRSRYLHDEAATTIDPSGLPFLEYSYISQGQRPRYRSTSTESSYSPGPSSRARYPTRRVCAPLNRPHPQGKRAAPYETLTTVCSDGTIIKETEC